jgi:septal ring factor EnvC (AmiA/AmiB activator)
MAPQHSSPAVAPVHAPWPGRALALVLVALSALVPMAVAAAEETMVHPGPPTVDGAQAALAEARTAHTTAETRRTEMEAELVATRQQIASLDDEQARLADELERAQRRVRIVTVRAYTGGGGARELAYLMDAEGAGDHLLRQELLVGGAVDIHDAIDHLDELRDRASEDVLELADRADSLVSGIAQAERDAARAAVQVERAQVALSAALAAERQNASGRADPGEAAWTRLRFCESGGVYTTNTGNGFYGAYQFDLQTWRSMGGSGLPSSAPYWEQDLRAKALFQARGAQPWPLCGRFLG